MKEASDPDGPGQPAFTQATFPPCTGARLQCIWCTLASKHGELPQCLGVSTPDTRWPSGHQKLTLLTMR